MKTVLLYMSESNRLKNMAMRFEFSRKTARRFVAGETVADAIAAIQELNRKSFAATLDNLGESVSTKEEATQAADEYLHALDEIKKSGVNSNVSLKLTQFGLLLDENFCMDNVERIVQKAHSLGNFVRIDMEGSALTDVTLRIVHGLHGRYQNVGTVIQSYLFRSEKDIAELLQKGIRVRLCKGAYKEPPEISFKEKSGTDRNYVALMKILLKSGVYHGIATHDPAMIQATREFAQKESIGLDTFEFQMLYGIRRDLQEELIREGYRVRIYVPYGVQWYSYLMRRMAERPANLMFVARNFLRG